MIAELEFYNQNNHLLVDNKLSAYTWLVRYPKRNTEYGYRFVAECDPSDTVACFQRTCLDETCVHHDMPWDCERTLRLLKT